MKGTHLALLLGLLSASAVARGDATNDRARARQIFEDAKAAFARGDYPAAASLFEQTAALWPLPDPLVDAAEAWENAKDPVRAAEDLDRVLALPGLTDQYRMVANQGLARLTANVGTIELTGAPTSSARVDGTAVTVPGRRRVAPGHHVIAVSDQASHQSKSIELAIAAGETRAVDTAPAGSSGQVVAVEDGRRRAGTPPIAAWTLFGVAGAGAVAAGVFTGLLVHEKSEYNSTGAASAKSGYDTYVAVDDVALGVAVGALAAGITLWVLHKPPASTSVGFGCAPLAGGVMCAVRAATF